ncbi:MAG: hypothetical protein GF341_06045, partial [candidate division Zixibacteria bacterium]|nr:hypothetical protein [candidate division Zixibacteria bacterium]
MSHRQSFSTEGHVHFLTFSCWQRRQFLRFPHEIATCLTHLDRAREIEQFDLWAYVVMPEHVHLLIRPRSDVYSMAQILRRIKEACARDILSDWRTNAPERMPGTVDSTRGPIGHRFWQPGGGYDRNLYSEDKIERAVEYVEWNPVRRELVADPLQWPWSSARAR